MEDQVIVKLSDSEIVTASLEQGRTIFKAMEKKQFNPTSLDSISKHYQATLKLVTPGEGSALQIESQLIEAYVAGAETGSVQDNIQKVHTTNSLEAYDTLLYTRPKVSSLPDGAVKVEGIWNIYLAKKNVIRAISKE